MNTKYARHILFVLLLAALAAPMVLGGCGKRPLPTAPAPSEETVQSLTLSAERAMGQEDYKRAETLYRRLLEQPELPDETKALAWRGLADSAVKNGHFRTALEALENLALTDPKVLDGWAWHESYLEVLGRLDRGEQAQFHLQTVVGDPAKPAAVRIDAGLALARELWRGGEYARAVQTLEDVYALFPAPSDKAAFESALARDLQEAPQSVFESLKPLATPENEIVFPYSLIRLEEARRLAGDAKTWPLAWRALTRLSEADAFAGPNLAAGLLEKLTAQRGRPGGAVALVLPLTGAYSEIGWKIARGAGAAQWELILSGIQADVRLLNSEAPDIEEQIRALPVEYSVVGGPLRRSVYDALKQAGLHQTKPFFTFLPSLPDSREGTDAWRFFPSPQDEIKVLLRLTTERLALRRLAVLYPEERFGSRMAELFREEVARLRGQSGQAETNMEGSASIWAAVDEPGAIPLGVAAEASYAPGDPTKWGRPVAEMLGVPNQPRGKDGEPLLPPEPEFEAVFLPDSWSNAELLIPHFYFYEEDRLLFLGPALWEEGLKHDDDIEPRYFRLTVFPGAFHDKSDAPGTRSLRQSLGQSGLADPDFWVALGYDFIRFATRLGEMPPMHDPQAVNALIGPAADMHWSMAPMAWDQNGKASQKLFLFQPSEDGVAPLDPEQLLRRLVNAREAHERRVMKLMEKQQQEKTEQARKKMDAEGSVQGAPPVEENLSPEEREVQRRFRTLLDSLEQRDDSEKP